MSVSIGELTGTVTLEDKMEQAFEHLLHYVEEGASEMEHHFGDLALGVTAVAGAIIGVTAAIVGMAVKGSELADVEAQFDRLAGGAENAHKVLEELSHGVAGTVDELKLMELANRALSSGAIKTAKDFGTVAEAARVLSRQGFGPMENQLNTIERALATGRTRSLQFMTGVIDLKGAEEKFATSLGKTRDELTSSQKTAADRIAIMEKLRSKIEQAGDMELSFAEKVKKAKVGLMDWIDETEKAVATSPHVAAAFDAIQAAIIKAFGGSGDVIRQKLIEWVNKFADAVAYYGPIIIQWLVDIGSKIISIWNSVRQAWDDVPDWFKNIARDATLASGAVLIAGKAFEEAGGSDALGNIANIAQVWSVLPDLFTKAGTALQTIKILGFANTVAYLLTPLSRLVLVIGTQLPEAFALLAAELATIAIPLAATAAVLTAAYQAYKLWSESKERDAANNRQSAVDAVNLTRLNVALGTSYKTLAEAIAEAGKRRNAFVGPEQPAGTLPGAPGAENESGTKAKKTADATKASIEKTSQLWDEYYGLIDKMSGDSLGMQLHAIDRWFTGQKAALDKSKKENADYWNQLAALESVYYAKTQDAEIEDEKRRQDLAEKAIESFQKLGLEGAAAVSKGFGGMPDVLKGLAQSGAQFQQTFVGPLQAGEQTATGFMALLSGMILPAHKIGTEIGTIATISGVAERAIGSTMDVGQRGAIGLTEESKKAIKQLHAMGVQSDVLAVMFHTSLKRIQDEVGTTSTTFGSMLDSFASVMTQMAQISGDTFHGIIKDIANIVVSWNAAHKARQAYADADAAGKVLAVGQGAAATLQATGSGSTLARVGGGALSGMETGAMIGSSFGPVGTVVGGAIGAVTGAITGLIRGLGSAMKELDKTRQAFIDNAGGVKVFAQAVQEATGSQKLLQDVFDAKSVDDYNAAVKKLSDTLTEYNSIVDARHSEGFFSPTELMANAETAYKVFTQMRDQGVFTAEQLTAAYRKYQQALADAGDEAAAAWLKIHGAEGMAGDAASQAGYQTVDQLQLAADQAEKLFEYMRDSGKYTAADIADAFQKAQDAAAKAIGGASADANQALTDLKKQRDDLAKSYENEAPEKEMGSIEKAARAGVDDLNKQIDAQTGKQVDAATTVAKAVDKATDESTQHSEDGWSDTVEINKAHWRDATDTMAADSVTAADASAKAFEDAFGKLVIPPLHVRVLWDADPKPFSTGGMVYASEGMFIPHGTDTVPAMLAPGERVLSVHQNQQFEQGLLQRSGSTAAPTSNDEEIGLLHEIKDQLIRTRVVQVNADGRTFLSVAIKTLDMQGDKRTEMREVLGVR